MANPNAAKNLPGPGPGRPKGVPNKFSELRSSFLAAFHSKELGGEQGLIEWARNPKNRESFYKMIVSMLPKQIEGTEEDGSITVKTSIQVTFVKPESNLSTGKK